MNRFQVCVTRTYSDGAYASYATSETWRKDIDALDDGFFKYLVLELASGEELARSHHASRDFLV